MWFVSTTQDGTRPPPDPRFRETWSPPSGPVSPGELRPCRPGGTGGPIRGSLSVPSGLAARVPDVSPLGGPSYVTEGRPLARYHIPPKPEVSVPSVPCPVTDS